MKRNTINLMMIMMMMNLNDFEGEEEMERGTRLLNREDDRVEWDHAAYRRVIIEEKTT